MKMSKTEYTITLNKYQRDNLLWLFRVCGISYFDQEDGIWPFTLANTGDWLGEIYWMLDPHLNRMSPNISFEEFEKQIKEIINNCKIYKEHCLKHNFVHGAEAEELRSCIEKILLHIKVDECDDSYNHLIYNLQLMLEKVDARDSLAFLEAQKHE